MKPISSCPANAGEMPRPSCRAFYLPEALISMTELERMKHRGTGLIPASHQLVWNDDPILLYETGEFASLKKYVEQEGLGCLERLREMFFQTADRLEQAGFAPGLMMLDSRDIYLSPSGGLLFLYLPLQSGEWEMSGEEETTWTQVKEKGSFQLAQLALRSRGGLHLPEREKAPDEGAWIEDEKSGRKYDFGKGMLCVGREAFGENPLVIRDPFAGRRHCQLFVRAHQA